MKRLILKLRIWWFGYQSPDEYFELNPLEKHYVDRHGRSFANIDLLIKNAFPEYKITKIQGGKEEVIYDTTRT